MKKTFKILILILFVAFSCKSAFCYTLTSLELKNTINSKVRYELKNILNTTDFETNITGIPNGNISSDKKIDVEINSQNYNQISPNIYKRVVVKDSDNNILVSFPVNIQLKIYKNVLTASSDISLNQEITQLNTKLERKDVTRYYKNTFDKFETGYIAKRNYTSGAIILNNSVSKKPDIIKDSMVDIVFTTKNLSVKLLGKALKSGAIGEVIPVRSEKYNRIYNAKINSQNEVIVRI